MDEPVTPEGEDEATAAEQRKERAALGCLLAVAVSVGGAVAVAVPETAYYAAGIGTALAVRKTRGWIAGRRGEADEHADAEDTVDIIAALHALSPAGAANVRLTQLVEATGLPDRDAIRALLAEAGIPTKEVRTGVQVGQGVHATAIPRPCGAPSDGCWCAVTSNNNTNNAPGEGPREGFRVSAIGAAGLVVTDPTETRRRHTKTPARSAR
ncbi:hypothetical protein [Streptomyces sp. NPDC056069]|uniref:hypothetical protein n=1 Tax=Streptomyces sp. NPDC056069 TaxID=3345702 RepID=UPI0035E257F6